MTKNKVRAFCLTCGIRFFQSRKSKYCSKKCWPSVIGQERVRGVFKDISCGAVGTLAELIVSIDLFKKGYEVYRALSPAAYCDIIAIKGDSILKLEIRTASYYIRKNSDVALSYSKSKTEGKIVVLVTHSDNKIHYPAGMPS